MLNGSNPRDILAIADAPLWTPMDEPWMTGAAPYTCNVPQVRTVCDLPNASVCCHIISLFVVTHALLHFVHLLQVAFLEAAHPEGDDRFRVRTRCLKFCSVRCLNVIDCLQVFFGGADAVVASAVIQISAK